LVELQGVQPQPLSLDEKCKQLEETIQTEAKNTRERAIQNNTRGAKNAHKLARTKKKRFYRNKARQLDEETLIEIE
jgi:hypothetical protein